MFRGQEERKNIVRSGIKEEMKTSQVQITEKVLHNFQDFGKKRERKKVFTNALILYQFDLSSNRNRVNAFYS